MFKRFSVLVALSVLPAAAFAVTPSELIETQRADLTARLNAIQVKISALTSCQQNGRLWDGNGCRPPTQLTVPTANVRVLSPVQVPADIVSIDKTLVVKSTNAWNASTGDTVLTVYRYSCSWGESKSVSNLVGDAVVVQPYVCNSRTIQQWQN